LNAGIKKRGVRKPSKYPQSSILADNPKKDNPPKPSKTPPTDASRENPQNTQKLIPRTSENFPNCQKPLILVKNVTLYEKRPVDLY